MGRRKLITCAYSKCDETFVPARKTGIYCSTKHRVYANREKKEAELQGKNEEKKEVIQEKINSEPKGGVCPHGTLRGYGYCPYCK